MDGAGRLVGPKGMPRPPFHTWLPTEDGQSRSLLRVKRKSEAPQSDCNFEALMDERSVAHRFPKCLMSSPGLTHDPKHMIRSTPQSLAKSRIFQMILVCGEARWPPNGA